MEPRMTEVSVIMNCYNGERYLRAALDSVRAQTFADWELIFWDNASTDRSAAIVREFAEPRVRYFRAERTTPLGEARAGALAVASGTWVGFLDSDDLWYPEKLARQLAALAGTQHALCYTAIHEITPAGAPLRLVRPRYHSGDMLAQQLMQYDINMVSPLLRRALLLQHRLTFNPQITASEEYNLFLRVLAHGTACALDAPLAAMRIGAGTLTDRQIARWADERFLTLAQLEEENPGLQARLPRAFAVAAARGEYYRARYLMHCGSTAEARAVLARVRDVDPAYRVMLALTYVRPLWDLAHSVRFKRKLLPRLWNLVAPR
jgi:glycosyltransferase involved in cell wall biosynthesis